MGGSIFLKSGAVLALTLALGACEAARMAPPLEHQGRRAQASFVGARHMLQHSLSLVSTESASVAVAKYDEFGYGIDVSASSNWRLLSIRSASTPEKELVYVPQREGRSANGLVSKGVVLLSDEDYRRASESGLQLRLTGVRKGEPFITQPNDGGVGFLEGFIPPEIFRDLSEVPERWKR
ncbi:hypothetical protein [Neomegalonema sp.]|uniref:hypothetical protein n=1 Tax=Neomegalonema sp. TaxID=2039713 RepID=UPI00260B84E3|nr:hypothetical protein [Neomegalonema sp.]MDD2868049.1 hypothetical protein [Neomegalonema sp.]